MGCSGCSVGNRAGAKDKDAGGCSSGGCSSTGCSTGGCNRFNTYDWLSDVSLPANDGFDLIEVSFKNGARKNFFHRSPSLMDLAKGDAVVVETDGGYDVGHVALAGELVKLQVKKRNLKPNTVFLNVLRKANERDMEKLNEIRQQEHGIMIQARVIARSLGLEMKIGDVEFQGDGRKATFFYTADGRVDFRELIRAYARDFKVKIEMRQITARTEAARIGGLGACGRELCCSTWLTDFKNVNTAAARYQNLSINQAKLSGQCGRLKCCLNYELDAYMEAFETFPKHADRISTKKGDFVLLKTDIFKGLMFYSARQQRGPALYRVLTTAQVKALLTRIAAGESLFDLIDESQVEERASSRRPNVTHVAKQNYNQSGNASDDDDDVEDADYMGDVDNVVELPNDKRKKRNRPNKQKVKGATDRPKPNDVKPNSGDKPAFEKKTHDRKPAENREGTHKDNLNKETKPKDNPNREGGNNENRPPRDRNNDRPKKPFNKENNRNENRPPRENQNKEGGNNENRPPRENRNNENRPPRDNNNRPPRNNNNGNGDNKPPKVD